MSARQEEPHEAPVSDPGLHRKRANADACRPPAGSAAGRNDRAEPHGDRARGVRHHGAPAPAISRGPWLPESRATWGRPAVGGRADAPAIPAGIFRPHAGPLRGRRLGGMTEPSRTATVRLGSVI